MRSEMMDIVAERPVKPTHSSAEFFRTFDSGIGKSWTVSVDLIGGASRDRSSRSAENRQVIEIRLIAQCQQCP